MFFGKWDTKFVFIHMGVDKEVYTNIYLFPSSDVRINFNFFKNFFFDSCFKNVRRQTFFFWFMRDTFFIFFL